MNRVFLANYSNEFFRPGSRFKVMVWYIFNFFVFNSGFPYPVSFKIFLIKLFNGVAGQNITIKPNVSIKYPWLLSIGDNCWIGENVWIDNLAQVSIGSNVCISQGAMLLTGNHNYKKDTFDLITGEITLEDGVWIGAKSVVCPGVTCFSHSVLAVGSVAVKNLESYSIYQGNPASKIRDRIIS